MPGAFGGSKKESVNSTTTIQLPAWVNEASQSNYKLAQQLGATPYNAAASEVQVAGLPADALAAFASMRENAGSQNEAYDKAAGAVSGLLEYSPDQVGKYGVTAGSLEGKDLSGYINPYTNEVIDRTLSDMDRQRVAALNSNSAGAAAAKSFGGSRHGVVDAITNAEAIRSSGDMSAQLRKSAFDMATQLATGDLNRKLNADTTTAGNYMAADQSNQNAKANAAGIIGTASGLLGNLAGAKQAGNMQDYVGLLDAADRQQGQTQAQLDANKANAGAQYNDKVDKLNLMLASLGMSPYGRTESTQGVKKTSSSADIGAMIAGAGKIASGFWA